MNAIKGGLAGSAVLNAKGPMLIVRNFKPGFRVRLHQKDLRICQAMSAALGVKLPVVEETLSDYAQTIADGHGDEDISALYRIKHALFAPKS